MSSSIVTRDTPTIIGMVHLHPLPGTPRYAGSIRRVLDAALFDAHALDEGGVDAIMIENYGDVPFRKNSVEEHTIACMTLVAAEIRRMTSKPLGINVLRNDARAAVAIASTVGASMVRVNVHTGAMLTDQGVVEGSASDTLAYRSRLGADVKILADIAVKHAAPLATRPIEDEAADAVERGLADALIVSGARTGGETDLRLVRKVRNETTAPILVGSGATADSIADILSVADGAIVGSWMKRDGDVSKPVDRERVRRLMDEVEELRSRQR